MAAPAKSAPAKRDQTILSDELCRSVRCKAPLRGTDFSTDEVRAHVVFVVRAAVSVCSQYACAYQRIRPSKIDVSRRGRLRGLTQFRRRWLSVRPQTLDNNSHRG